MPRFLLPLECLLIFGALPPLLAALKPHGWIYLLLWLLAFAAYHSLRKHYDYDRRKDWNLPALNRRNIKPILRRFVPCAAIIFAFACIAIPERLFSLPLERPLVWAMVMILYPLLSVVPQEFLFRSFFFKRYAALFPSPRALMAASALAFGWAHIVLMNWVAVAFSAAGGLLFAHTYGKNKSLALACFEHALYGCFLFTIGMGFYFYHGQAVR